MQNKNSEMENGWGTTVKILYRVPMDVVVVRVEQSTDTICMVT